MKHKKNLLKQKFLFSIRTVKHKWHNYIWKKKYHFHIAKRHFKFNIKEIRKNMHSKIDKKALTGLGVVLLMCIIVITAAYSRQKVNIYIDGEINSYCFISSGGTVSDALEEADIYLSYNDYVYPSLSDPIGQDGRVDIYLPETLTVEYNSEVYSISTPLLGDDALKQAGLYLSDDDIVSIDYETNVVKVTAQNTAETTQVIDLDYDTEVIKNDDQYTDYKKVITKGEDGKAVATIITTYIDGKAVKKEQLITQLLQSPVSEVIEVGTKKRPNTVQTTLGEKLYSKSYIANISAYCPCAICCGKYTGGYTASGSKAKQYYTIAAPSNIPFGTKVYIPYFKNAPNKGVFVVQDRGGAISGNRIDIFFDEHQQALNFGRKYLKIYILE
jgi:3D (Asp-Asp-Asp) domain-containing protein